MKLTPDEMTQLTRRIACDLANDAHCLERGAIDSTTAVVRMFGYARELTDATEWDGPQSLREYERDEHEFDNDPTERCVGCKRVKGDRHASGCKVTECRPGGVR